jgi:hypothetical protein
VNVPVPVKLKLVVPATTELVRPAYVTLPLAFIANPLRVTVDAFSPIVSKPLTLRLSAKVYVGLAVVTVPIESGMFIVFPFVVMVLAVPITTRAEAPARVIVELNVIGAVALVVFVIVLVIVMVLV